MSVLKVVEVLAESEESWEKAAQSAVKHAAKTLRNIKSIHIDHFQATVDNETITRYRVNARISFSLE